MNRPSLHTRIVGYPLVVIPVELACCVALYACWQGGSDGVLPGLAVAFVMAEAARAYDAAHRYVEWKREWNSYDNTRRPPSRFWLKLGMVVGGLWSVFVALVAGQSADVAGVLVAWIAGVLAMAFAPVMLLALHRVAQWLFRRRPRAPRRRFVTVVAKTIVRAPALTATYNGLPEHCRAILAHRS